MGAGRRNRRPAKGDDESTGGADSFVLVPIHFQRRSASCGPACVNRDELAVSCGFRRLGEDHPSEFRAMGRKMELAKSSSSIAPEIECRPNVSDVSLRSRHVPAQAPVNARVLGAVVRVRRRRAVVGT